MIDDDDLYAEWLAASRRAKQPQTTYPQIDTLREFARRVWLKGFGDSQIGAECPY